jgi:hypothetical protein
VNGLRHLVLASYLLAFYVSGRSNHCRCLHLGVVAFLQRRCAFSDFQFCQPDDGTYPEKTPPLDVAETSETSLDNEVGCVLAEAKELSGKGASTTDVGEWLARVNECNRDVSTAKACKYLSTRKATLQPRRKISRSQ